MARALGSPLLARGALELLWDSCYESGEDYVGTSEDVENLIGWQGDPAGWVATRIRILIRDGWSCRYCRSFADTVDHVIPRAKGSGHHDGNLVAACRRCNGIKQDRTPEEAGLVLHA